MSANNYIRIRELKNGRFEVTERDMDTGTQWNSAKTTDDLRKAIKIAQDWEEDGLIEYGIFFKLLK